MKVKTFIFLAIGSTFISLLFYYFYPYTPMPDDVTIDKIVILKSQHQLLAYSKDTLIRVYKISLGKNPVEPKRYEGDYRTPEGTYIINDKNANSNFHKSLGISYPNKEDLAKAKQIGKAAGGDIKIHGLRNDQWYFGKFQRWKDWTSGCIALTNEEIDDLYRHTSVGIPVEIKR